MILGGHVMDPASNLDAVRNIGLSGGRIAVITTRAIQGRDTVDARGRTCHPIRPIHRRRHTVDPPKSRGPP